MLGVVESVGDRHKCDDLCFADLGLAIHLSHNRFNGNASLGLVLSHPLVSRPTMEWLSQIGLVAALSIEIA